MEYSTYMDHMTVVLVPLTFRVLRSKHPSEESDGPVEEDKAPYSWKHRGELYRSSSACVTCIHLSLKGC